MTIAEKIKAALKDYPEDKFDLIFDESGSIMGVAPKARSGRQPGICAVVSGAYRAQPIEKPTRTAPCAP